MSSRPQQAQKVCYIGLFSLAVLSGCASHPPEKEEPFHAETPFSERILGSGKIVCWSARRAFLTQGYMLDRSDDGVMTGTKDSQPDADTNITLRLQATCADNRDGTSTVFASATQETSKLQSSQQSVSAGVSIATITVPVGSEKSLHLMKRETIQDPKFYQSFYRLVEKFAQEEVTHSSTGAQRSDDNGDQGPRPAPRQSGQSE